MRLNSLSKKRKTHKKEKKYKRKRKTTISIKTISKNEGVIMK